MADSLDTLCNATGIKRAEMLDLWAEVQANHARLETCAGHDFGQVEPGRLLNRKYECRNCHGWADAHAVAWYQKGVEHGRRREN